MLVKAGDLLAPDCFVHTLARPSTSPEEAGGGGKGLQSQANNGSFLDFHDKGRRRGDYNLAKEQVDEHAKEVEQNREKERYVLGSLSLSLSFSLSFLFTHAHTHTIRKYIPTFTFHTHTFTQVPPMGRPGKNSPQAGGLGRCTSCLQVLSPL